MIRIKQVSILDIYSKNPLRLSGGYLAGLLLVRYLHTYKGYNEAHIIINGYV